ncbi:MAG: polyprenyl synthetase family protein [Candidatus Adiutrix sp.]|nr:polyprenyl synthetase family protein [Candidatus Adiutrix sp.]
MKVTAMTRAGADFEAWRRPNAARLEKGLAQALARQTPGQPAAVTRLLEAMSYALLGGGKLVRPLLALAAAEAVGGRAREARAAALAVEMIHAYSLVHDDLPAMDNDDLRRGRPTCHKVFGEALAILAGDALLTLAFQTLAEAGRLSAEAGRRAGLATLHLARAAGAVGLIGGQALDLAFEGQTGSGSNLVQVTGEMASDMERRKTGELMAAALVTGACLAGGTLAALNRLRRIGLDLGLAFQIKDDLLNREGDPALLGKATGSDEARGKASFPAVCGSPAAQREMDRLARSALAGAAWFKLKGRPLIWIIDSLLDRQS